MKAIKIISISSVVCLFMVNLVAAANFCKVRYRDQSGLACLKRGPCEPLNNLLLDSLRQCREGGDIIYSPMTRLRFADLLFQVMRLDTAIPKDLSGFSDVDRYKIESKILARKGIDIFVGKKGLDPVLREEFVRALKAAKIKETLGYSSGLSNQAFDVGNGGFVVYDMNVYVDQGKGPEKWERVSNFNRSTPDSRHYVVKLDSYGDIRILFGDGKKGYIPLTGSKISTSYRIYGKESEFVTECEAAKILSNPVVARALRKEHNPSRLLTRANFVDLLVRSMHLEGQLPKNARDLSVSELYRVETNILKKQGIPVFIDKDPSGLLKREELARILYDYPVVEVLGVSNGRRGQEFKLDNAGFVIYDLHVYVDQGAGFEEWNKKEDFLASGPGDKDYIVKVDSGNYARIFFGDDNKGMVPAVNSPIKASYRLYAPLSMMTEDDIACVLGRLKPVVETYVPPPLPPDFPPPTDGHEDPATHT